MEILTAISIILGIIITVIALLEKFFHIFPHNRGARKLFEDEFRQWKESGFAYIPAHEKICRFINSGYMVKTPMADEKKVFSLLCAIQHGDGTMHNLIEKNSQNNSAIPYVICFLNGRGIRVGWRAEYVLSQLDLDKFKEHVASLSDHDRENIKDSYNRIVSGKVLDFLEAQKRGQDSKSRAYAIEVLTQIKRRPISNQERGMG